MNAHRIYRGQPKEFDSYLFVPSALRGYQPEQYPFSGDVLKTETFLQDIDVNTAPYKKACEAISKKCPFQDCASDVPYIFWLSIVFCEHKFSHDGKNTSFMGGGPVPYGINKGFDDNGEFRSLICANTIEEYALEMACCYFKVTPPANEMDHFIRKYMDHQHYFKGNDNDDPCLKGSFDYDFSLKSYKTKCGRIIDGNDLPDHFTFLLDWTDSKDVAKKFAKADGTIVSIDLQKYEAFIGSNYKMSYDDKIIQYYLIDTADRQKSVVVFWPWTFTIGELEKNEFGRALDFKRE
jgi:hypothetical protein